MANEQIVEKKRIIDMTERTTVTDDVYIATDEASVGTRKYQLSRITGDISDLETDVSDLKEELNLVSPEMYGATGDGVTDDTSAIQQAIDSGKNVKFASASYKTGTISVTRNMDIDCGNSEFICTENVLFDCSGSAATATSENDYSADSTYSLSDTFTGLVYLVGTNNLFRQRSYYVGGSIEPFYQGRMLSVVPFDITSVSAYRLSPIAVNIKNIGDVSFVSETDACVIKQTYCAFSQIKNIRVTHVCYQVVSFVKCYGCEVSDCHLDIPQYGEAGANSYPLGCNSSCQISFRDCYVHNVGWHCIDGGGTTPCRGMLVENCRAYTDYGTSAINNHENCIETKVLNCTATSITLGALSSVKGCIIESNQVDMYCRINVHLYEDTNFGKYNIEDTLFNPRNTLGSLVRLYCSPQSSGVAYNYGFKNLTLKNVKNVISGLPATITSVIENTGVIEYGIISVIDSDFVNATKAFCEKYPENIWGKANAIESTASGRVASITDGAKDTPAKNITIDDNTATMVTRTGKNIFDSSVFLKGDGWTESEGEYSGLSQSIHYEVIGDFLTNLLPYTGRLTISFDDKVDSDKRAGYIWVAYADGTSSNKALIHQSWASNTLITDDNKTINRIYFVTSNNGITTHLRNFQVEFGTSKTTFEEYNGNIYYDVADGEVNQPVPTHLGTNKIFANSGNVTVDYVVDTKTYIDSH